MTDFRQVVPSTQTAYQYLLVWLSVDGGLRSWMFSNTDGMEAEKFDSFMVEGLDDIRSVPMMDRTQITASVKSLTLDNFNYVKSIMASNRVYQVDSDGEQIPVGIKSGAITRLNKGKEYQIKIKFVFGEKDTL